MLSLASIGEALTQLIFGKLGYDIDRYCRLEAVYDDTTLITETGGLLTIVELKGIRGMPGEEETLKIFNSWIQELSAIFKNGDHTLQVVFESDPGSARSEIDALAAPMWATAKRLQLDIEDVLTDYFDAVARRCSRERCWIVLETHPTMLAKDVLKKSLRNRLKYMEREQIPYLTQAQNSFRLIPELTTPHKTMVSSFVGEMDSVGVSLDPMNLVEALREVRRAIDPEFTANDWEAALPGKNRLIKKLRNKPDRLPVRHGTGPENEMSHVWYPPLSRQLVARRIVADPHADFPSTEPVRVGNVWFSSLVLDCGPDDPQTFLRLFRRIAMDIPWRISYEIRPGGLQGLWFSRLVVKIFGWMGETNRKIRDALDDLSAYEQRDGTVVGLRVCATTWAEDPKELSRRHATLARAIQGWGQCQVTDNVGDPVESFLATVPAFYAQNPAVSMAAPLPDVVHMLPLTRPASPWRTGVVMFRTPDGRLYPMNIASPEQASWVDLISAPMGAGKSVLLNTINLMSAFAAGAEDVPWMLVIDVGPSSSGVANLLKSALPENLRHKVEYFKLRMDVKSSINPFDTQLGCRKPTAMEREFQVNFFQLLMTEEGETSPYSMAGKMAGVMIDEIYDLFSDKRNPKLYEQHCDPLVDLALESIRFRPEGIVTWWKIVDVLFAAGRIHEATIAQRYAVPLLHDFMGIVKSSIIRDLFAESVDNAVQAGNGQMLIDAFSTVISSTIREFPVLSGVTRFDIGDARMVVMDLDEVARDRGRRAAIMYMLARYVGTRNFYLMPEMTASAPNCYHDYHLKRVREIKEVKKALVYDEFHRTDGILALRKQVLTDMREGRKWNIRIALSSQILDDFDKEMIDLSSSIYILRPANQADIRRLCDLFGLSDVAAIRMERDLSAPSAAGANFLTIQNTKKGRYVQVLTNTIGPITRWALTTTAEEMGLRNRLYERMDPREAREVLALMYPSGAQDVIEERQRNMDGEETALLDQMANEVVRFATEIRMKKRLVA